MREIVSIKQCKNCLNPVTNKRNIFCSKSCSASYNNKITKKKNKKCKMCEKEAKSIFCSGSCHVEYRKQEKFKDVINGTANAKQCKKYLIEKYGNKCLNEKCAWDFSKVSIDVELEHIDGNASNNNPSNLTLLCPNCHSLTKTYKNRNKGNGRAIRLKRYHEGKSY